MIRLLVADDNEAIRFGLQALLADEPDITVIGTAADGRQAVTMAVADPPDVVLMDLSMPVLDGVTATREIVREAPSAKVLVLTSSSQAGLPQFVGILGVSGRCFACSGA